MKFIPTDLPGVLVIEPDVYRDERGFFLETYHAEKYAAGGVPVIFLQANHSRSVGRTVRGLHAQRRRSQGKLVRAIHGEILDVVVDIRRGSPTFQRWVGVTLSAENFRQCYIPPGFAHGFGVTSEWAELEYKCTNYYDPADEIRLLWNDPQIGITWPVQDPIISDKDRTAQTLAALWDTLPVFGAGSE